MAQHLFRKWAVWEEGEAEADYQSDLAAPWSDTSVEHNTNQLYHSFIIHSTFLSCPKGYKFGLMCQPGGTLNTCC